MTPKLNAEQRRLKQKNNTQKNLTEVRSYK